MRIVRQLRQGLANWLDVVQRYLSDDTKYSGLSRSQLISRLEKVTNQYEKVINQYQNEDLSRQIIRLLDDIEGAARGDLSVRAEVTADVLGAIGDSFNVVLDNLCELIAELPQESPLRQKYRLPNKFYDISK